MPICAECGKKIDLWAFRMRVYGSGGEFCCVEHRDKYAQRLKEAKSKEREMSEKGMIKEIKCKCNQCGKIWHYLESREKEIEKDIKLNAGIQAGFAFFNVGAATQAKRNVEAQQDLLDKLKKCPECGSHDITKEDIYYKKK